MVDVLRDNREAIAELCARYGVARLFVFGSALRDDYRPGVSDVDLLVELGRMEPHGLADAYFDLHDELRAVLGVEVDLVVTGAVKNPYISQARCALAERGRHAGARPPAAGPALKPERRHTFARAKKKSPDSGEASTPPRCHSG